MNSALQQAIGLQSDTQQAATTGLLNDPMAAQLTAARAEDQKIKDAAALKIQDNITRKAEVMAEPLPAAPLPEYAALPEKPKTPVQDPMRVFGQFLPVLAAFGGLTTRNPAVNALNAATAAINAAKANDKEALATAHTDWLDNLKSALAANEMASKKYQDLLGNRKMSWDEKAAKLEMLATESQDTLALANLRAGNAAGIESLMKMRDASAGKLTELVNDVEERNATAARDAESRRSHLANEATARVNAGKMSPGQVIAPILAKVASTGAGSLTPAEKDALTQYQQLSTSAANTSVLGGMLSGGGGYGGPAAGPATSNAGAGAVATAAPPVSLLKEGVRTTLTGKDGKDSVWTLQGGKAVKVG